MNKMLIFLTSSEGKRLMFSHLDNIINPISKFKEYFSTAEYYYYDSLTPKNTDLYSLSLPDFHLYAWPVSVNQNQYKITSLFKLIPNNMPDNLYKLVYLQKKSIKTQGDFQSNKLSSINLNTLKNTINEEMKFNTPYQFKKIPPIINTELYKLLTDSSIIKVSYKKEHENQFLVYMEISNKYHIDKKQYSLACLPSMEMAMKRADQIRKNIFELFNNINNLEELLSGLPFGLPSFNLLPSRHIFLSRLINSIPYPKKDSESITMYFEDKGFHIKLPFNKWKKTLLHHWRNFKHSKDTFKGPIKLNFENEFTIYWQGHETKISNIFNEIENLITLIYKTIDNSQKISKLFPDIK